MTDRPPPPPRRMGLLPPIPRPRRRIPVEPETPYLGIPTNSELDTRLHKAEDSIAEQGISISDIEDVPNNPPIAPTPIQHDSTPPWKRAVEKGWFTTTIWLLGILAGVLVSAAFTALWHGCEQYQNQQEKPQ
jgi:hypothetical protein